MICMINFFVFQRLKPTQIVNVLSLIFNKFALNLIFNANLLDQKAKFKKVLFTFEYRLFIF